jgi:hypothetical protein
MPAVGQVIEARSSLAASKPRPKTKVWPRPKFSALAASGKSPANLMVIRILHAALPTKPKASFHGAAWRLEEAISAIRDAASTWLSNTDHQPNVRFSKLLLSNALGEIMSIAFGSPAGNDPCYYTRRHVVDRLGCQLYALLGDDPPHRFIPLGPKLEKLSRELDLGWPLPRPPWERRGIFLTSKSSVSIESRGASTFARWSRSEAADRGVFHTFDDHNEATEWFETLSPHLVFTQKGGTRLISAHDTAESAALAATAAAAVSAAH